MRLKITAYLDADTLDEDGYIDRDDPTKLTDRGYDEVMNAYTLADFEEVTTELVQDSDD